VQLQRITVFLLLLFLPAIALADGIVIPPVAYAVDVTIPDQQALICWANGVERLAIETRFTGSGTNFAWVIPLPAKPKIEEVSPGLFPTLELIFRPTIIHNVVPLYLILLTCIGLAYLLLTVRRNTPARISDTVVSIAVALAIQPISACIGWPLVVFLPYATWRVRSGKVGLWFIWAVVFLMVLLASMLLPALNTPDTIAPDSGISMLGHQTVGEYDITTITAQKPGALEKWLDENGYAIPSAGSNVISNYLHKHWVFVVMKAHRDATGRATNALRPLCFTFNADTAFYPMQLTGIGSDKLSVDLFVFGPARAEAQFFNVERCAMPAFPQFMRGVAIRPSLQIVHPQLRDWVSGSAVATLLTANLDSAQMTDDIKLNWVPFRETHHDLYSQQGAWFSGLNYGIGVFAVFLLLASLVTAAKRSWQPHSKVLAGIGVIAGAIVTLAFFTSVSKTPVRLFKHSSIFNVRNIAMIYLMEDETNHITTLAQSRAVIEKIQTMYPTLDENTFFGGPIREEDSPGNYVLRQATNGVEFVWFDASGREQTLDE
jgi:hypothetical protein